MVWIIIVICNFKYLQMIDLIDFWCLMPLSTILQLYDLLERGCRWFHKFFVDFQSFYFLSRIIPAYNIIIYGMNYHSDMQLQVFTNDWFDWFLVFNATFSNISAISGRPVLVVEEAGVPRENHRPWANNWSTLSFAAVSRVHPIL